MPEVLLPGSVLALSGQAADRLLRLDSGDAALLYLHLLRRGSLDGLPWPSARLQTAQAALASIGLAPEPAAMPAPDAPPPPVLPADQPPPEYSSEDLSAALRQEGSTFPPLADEVERRLGKKLTANDLKTLFTLYDHLALPPEVILMAASWCVEEQERKYGPGRRPFLSQISRECFRWSRQGIDTAELAEAHLHRLAMLRSRGSQVLRLLDIAPRPLVARERDYVAAWTDMGFEDGALRLAYEKTVLKKQSMDWSYMNGILRGWHKKGLHTVQAIEEGDSSYQRKQPPPPPSRTEPASQRAQEDMDRMRRLRNQMKEEG